MSSERRVPTRRSTFMLAGEEDQDSEVSRLELMLEVDPKDLDAELAGQPALYYRAALMVARLESQVQAAEYEVRAAEERAAGPLRERNLTLHEPLTEEQIAMRVRQSADVDRAERRAGELRRRLLSARALGAAYMQRLRVLEVLGARAG